MNEAWRESRVAGWVQKGLRPFGQLNKKVDSWLADFLKEIQAAPLAVGGVLLLAAVGINLYWIFLLEKTISPGGLFFRFLFFMLALFLMRQRTDWKQLSSDSLFLQWLRRH